MMKKFILSLSAVVLIGLTIALYYYQTAPQAQEKVSLDNQPKTSQNNEQPAIQAEEIIDYAWKSNELHITFNKGKTWMKVPVEKEQLFNGEYNGNQEELINGSYMLTKQMAAFLHSDNQKIELTYSFNHGENWRTTVVSESFPSIRFRKVAFLNDTFGYIILTGDRTMSQEFSSVYVTHDRGNSWKETVSTNVTRLLADGGFVDENNGFLSYGILNPDEPQLLVTNDGGASWNEAKFNRPAKYNEIFVTAEIPAKEDDHLAVLINQGTNGDYQGGQMKGKFISLDQGRTWEFSKEVGPDEAK